MKRLTPIPLTLALAASCALVSTSPAFTAQAQAAAPSRIVGTVTAVNGQSITLKPDKGDPVTLTVSDSARILETQPGAKTLAGATPIQVSGISVGDRVLAAISPSSTPSALTATTVIAMKQSAIAASHQAQEAAWQREGVGGLVKTVDAPSGVITIASGQRTLTIHTTPGTTFRRYSPDSIKFADATPATLAAIHSGDQLRARGAHSPDGSEVTADEVVSGTFRNIAAVVLSTDPAANAVTVRDLATKKPVVIHITADSQMHKLPESMAQALAARFKRAPGNPSGNQPEQQVSARPQYQHSSQQSGSADHSGDDLTRTLQRTPALQISELHKGDAVMIVATQGTPDSATAVVLVAGVEPILTASPSASQSMFSASWNVSGNGSTEAAGGEGTP